MYGKTSSHELTFGIEKAKYHLTLVSELGCSEFFLCAKMDDNMIKLNSMNYST